jgi:hypothetical protein
MHDWVLSPIPESPMGRGYRQEAACSKIRGVKCFAKVASVK